MAGNQFSASGIITAITDVDYFSFETGSGQISLSVDVGAYTNLDARLELRTDTGVLIASANPSNSFGATITTTVGAGIYRLVVASGGGYGNVGQYTVSGTLQTPSTAVIAPINLTSNTTGGQANLSWVDKAYNENSYFVDRSDDGLSWNNVATLGANANTWSDTNVTAGATYYYRVWAAGDVENSGYSNIRTVTMPPSIPTGLAANAVSSSILNLTWNDVSGETGFLIQRSTSGSSTWTQIATVGAGVTSYQNTGLKANTSYAYRVIATNSGGASAFSSVANGTTLPIPPAPLAGSGLAAHAVSTSQVDLTWTDNASNESGYIVQRATGSGTFKQIAALGADATTFSDTTAIANKTFKYRVRAFNDGGNSAYSNTGSATTPVVIAPSALIGTVVSSAKVDLTWTDNGSTELGFRIERYSGNSWKQIAEVGPDVTTFSDTTVAANKSYKYRVHAFDAGGNSVVTNTVSLKTPVVIAPSTLAGAPNGATEVDVAWLDNGSDEAGFRIERATGSGSWKQIAEVGTDVTSFSDTTVVANKSYKYRVRAFNTAGTSAYTNTVTIKTPIAATVPSASLASPTPSSTPASSTPASNTVVGSHGSIPGSIVGVPRGAVLSSQASLSLDELVHAVFADDDWIKHLLSHSV